MGDNIHAASLESIACAIQGLHQEVLRLREEVVFLRKKLRVEETPTERRQRLEPRAINLLSELMVNELPLTKRAIAREIGVPESTLRQWTGPNSFNERFGKAIASLKAQLADKVSQSVAEDEFWE